MGVFFIKFIVKTWSLLNFGQLNLLNGKFFFKILKASKVSLFLKPCGLYWNKIMNTEVLWVLNCQSSLAGGILLSYVVRICL